MYKCVFCFVYNNSFTCLCVKARMVLVESIFCLGSLVQIVGTIFKSPKPMARYMADEVPILLLLITYYFSFNIRSLVINVCFVIVIPISTT